jgi:hypothetical protein
MDLSIFRCCWYSGIFSCLLAAQGGGSTGTGIQTAISYALEVDLDTFSMGFSMTNAFELVLKLFTGDTYVEYATRPTYTTSVNGLAMKSEKIHARLKNKFVLSGKFTQGLIISSLSSKTDVTLSVANFSYNVDHDTVKTAFESNLQAFDTGGGYLVKPERHQDKSNLLDMFEDSPIQIVAQGLFSVNLTTSNIPYVKRIIKKDLTFELPEGSALISTTSDDIVVGGIADPVSIHAGLYIYIGWSVAAIDMRTTIETVFNSLAGILVSPWIIRFAV